jgi:hypothetical protein
MRQRRQQPILPEFWADKDATDQAEPSERYISIPFPTAAPRARSLSSGVDSLPSDCTREASVATGPDAAASSVGASTDSERTLRKRTKHPDYVSHPMDQMKKDIREGRQTPVTGRAASTDSSEEGRRVRGRSACPPAAMLPASNGKKSGTGAKWPKHGGNTVKGRMVSPRIPLIASHS